MPLLPLGAHFWLATGQTVEFFFCLLETMGKFDGVGNNAKTKKNILFWLTTWQNHRSFFKLVDNKAKP